MNATVNVKLTINNLPDNPSEALGAYKYLIVSVSNEDASIWYYGADDDTSRLDSICQRCAEKTYFPNPYYKG